MGVPAFYRWLSTKYPKIIVDCVEDSPTFVDGEEIPVDTTQPNPNGLEFDNLYLDMNGIIHPCFHPEDRPAPTTETEVFLCIFDYIDRLFAIVRPRKLLYMAIDGVAPRAKMNQQRSRRFKAAQEAQEKEAEEEKLRLEFAKQGMKIPKKEKNEVFDSNTITPGTPFMHRLSIALQYYVHLRLNSDPGWRDISVMLSDANVPGEGEHKVMSFVREQRGRPGWNPATRHCLYGLDADLIMLGLATHEPRFVILREVITQPQKDSKAPTPLGQLAGKERADATLPESFGKQSSEEKQLKPFQFLMVNILREYLALELRVRTPFPFDAERVYDDFVFMCFFCGNDFLPHMPTLDIREGAIELLMHTYKQELARTGYLTDGATVLMQPVEKFIQVVGAFEDAIFQKRMRMLQRDKRRRANDRSSRRSDGGSGSGTPRSTASQSRRLSAEGRTENRKWSAARLNEAFTASLTPSSHQPAEGRKGPILLEPRQQEEGPPLTTDGNQRMANLLRDSIKSGHQGTKRSPEAREAQAVEKRQRTTTTGPTAAKWPSKLPATSESSDVDMSHATTKQATDVSSAEGMTTGSGDDAPDAKQTEEFAQAMSERLKGKSDMFDEMVVHEESIRLGEEGWRERYYKAKIGLSEAEQQPIVRAMVRSYVEGLAWVMRYYYDGVASWTWFYPFHYAPFASDLRGLSSMTVDFKLGEPFKPFNQLMGVLPAASAHALPSPYQPLFTSDSSPILDFYPAKFKSDMNGKRFSWQAVVLLPFIDEQRLLAATEPLELVLEEEERWRNGKRLDQLYVGPAHLLCPDIFDLGSKQEQEPQIVHVTAINPELTGGMVGELLAPAGDVCPMLVTAPFKLGDDITANGVCCIAYRNPPHRRHICRPLEDQTLEPRALTEHDLAPPKALWHEDTRGRPGNSSHSPWDHGQYQQQHFYPNGQPVGPLSQGAHRMLSHSLASTHNDNGFHPEGSGPHSSQHHSHLNPHAPVFWPQGPYCQSNSQHAGRYARPEYTQRPYDDHYRRHQQQPEYMQSHQAAHYPAHPPGLGYPAQQAYDQSAHTHAQHHTRRGDRSHAPHSRLPDSRNPYSSLRRPAHRR